VASPDPEGIVRCSVGEGAEAREYKLHFGFRAQKETEQKFDKPFVQAIEQLLPALQEGEEGDAARAHAEFTKVSYTDLGTLFGFALLKHHGEVGDDEIEDIIDEIGTMGAIALLMRSIQAAMMKGAKEAGATAGADPRRGRQRR
jgi:hypothetical protein